MDNNSPIECKFLNFILNVEMSENKSVCTPDHRPFGHHLDCTYSLKAHTHTQNKKLLTQGAHTHTIHKPELVGFFVEFGDGAYINKSVYLNSSLWSQWMENFLCVCTNKQGNFSVFVCLLVFHRKIVWSATI